MAIEHPSHHPQRTKANWILIGFVVIAAFFLLTEHRAHLSGVLPYVLLLACPLLHLFMHGGHGANEKGHQHMADSRANHDDAKEDKL